MLLYGLKSIFGGTYAVLKSLTLEFVALLPVVKSLIETATIFVNFPQREKQCDFVVDLLGVEPAESFARQRRILRTWWSSGERNFLIRA